MQHVARLPVRLCANYMSDDHFLRPVPTRASISLTHPLMPKNNNMPGSTGPLQVITF